jgi:hypothetical protein
MNIQTRLAEGIPCVRGSLIGIGGGWSARCLHYIIKDTQEKYCFANAVMFCAGILREIKIFSIRTKETTTVGNNSLQRISDLSVHNPFILEVVMVLTNSTALLRLEQICLPATE